MLYYELCGLGISRFGIPYQLCGDLEGMPSAKKGLSLPLILFYWEQQCDLILGFCIVKGSNSLDPRKYI